MKNRGMLAELFAFMRTRKKYWLLPIIIMMVLVAVVILFAYSTPLSPLIYALI